MKRIREKPWYNHAVALSIAVVLYVLLTNWGSVREGIGDFFRYFSPVIWGAIIAYSKVRGKKAAVAETVRAMERHAVNGKNYDGKCFICHANCLEDAEITRRAVLDNFPNLKEVRICDIGTIIASHCGPGTVAVFFMGDERAPGER